MIDRHGLVTRHNPVYTALQKDAPLSVGNGAFCVTADFTGLQTFYDDYAAGDDAFPLCIMADWGWHSYANAPRLASGAPDDTGLRLTPFDTWGRPVGYATDETGQDELFYALRQNAHKFNLAKIAFELDGAPLARETCKPVKQTLNLWEGILTSEFTIHGERVWVETYAHPREDSFYITAKSPLIEKRALGIAITFPYGSHKKTGSDFSAGTLHTTTVEEASPNHLTVKRVMDSAVYYLTAGLGSGVYARTVPNRHRAVFTGGWEDSLSVVFHFVPAGLSGKTTAILYPALFSDARSSLASFWHGYWTSGGAIDFTGSGDSRAEELERRIVLSQYLTAIQSRSALPPAETGLACNSWYGKFHLEMHYWHSAHWALWGRVGALKQSLEYYKQILPVAKKIAESQGYCGARWPKMCDPSGCNTPSSVAVLLIWQQPHPILLAELCYRAAPDEAFLREYRDIIVETANFMHSFVHLDGDSETNRYVLGPPYIPAQERHDPRVVLNAPYELEYFRWGFIQADVWLERLGEKPRFTEIAEKLALPAQKDGVYLAHENCPDTFTKLPFYTDHPSMLAMYGILKSEKVDPAVMSATLDKVLETWDMRTFYGWDFPLMAMTACRLGRSEDAVNLLLLDSPKNTYLANGHNKQAGDASLPVYLPGNGGLLIAAAMLAAGYDGKTGSLFPKGFAVQTEGLHAYI
jgi:hypothetical protein